MDQSVGFQSTVSFPPYSKPDASVRLRLLLYTYTYTNKACAWSNPVELITRHLPGDEKVAFIEGSEDFRLRSRQTDSISSSSFFLSPSLYSPENFQVELLISVNFRSWILRAHTLSSVYLDTRATRMYALPLILVVVED